LGGVSPSEAWLRTGDSGVALAFCGNASDLATGILAPPLGDSSFGPPLSPLPFFCFLGNSSMGFQSRRGRASEAAASRWEPIKMRRFAASAALSAALPWLVASAVGCEEVAGDCVSAVLLAAVGSVGMLDSANVTACPLNGLA
jgi:hypothetical protein